MVPLKHGAVARFFFNLGNVVSFGRYVHRERVTPELSARMEMARRIERHTNFLGEVGTDFQFAGLGRFFGSDTTDMLLRSASTGAFEVYDIAGNTLVGAASLGTVGLDWQLGGFAADPPTPSGAFADGSNDQLVQAMAGFGGGAADSSSAVPFAADTSQQQFLTMPQHA